MVVSWSFDMFWWEISVNNEDSNADYTIEQQSHSPILLNTPLYGPNYMVSSPTKAWFSGGGVEYWRDGIKLIKLIKLIKHVDVMGILRRVT